MSIAISESLLLESVLVIIRRQLCQKAPGINRWFWCHPPFL